MLQRNIVATKMPSPRLVLLDLAGTYMEELQRQRIRLDTEYNASLLQQGGRATFALLHAWAEQGISAAQQAGGPLTPDAQADVTCLYEIRDKVAALVGMFDALRQREGDQVFWDNPYTRDQFEALQHPLPVTLEEFVMLRKFWEFGLEDVVMQTVLQVDGNSVTRIHPDYATNEYVTLQQIHHRGLQTSVAFWGELVGVVQGIFRSVFSRRS